MEERRRYFDEALSDFIHDAASGGAIRHLVDLGYSLEQIMQSLSYPTPRERVRSTAYRYMLESGLLLRQLPGEAEAGLHIVRLPVSDREGLYGCLQENIRKNGDGEVYFACPFGTWRRPGDKAGQEEQIRDRLACLNGRERDYIAGIPWENRMMYHRLNARMREIGRKLILCPGIGYAYDFLHTGVRLEGTAGERAGGD